ncbi:MAG: tetratricopeptide repeat protein, partial [Gemmatimonadota bacterium]|nr:tetratricopeptide repeat protein [Gemmatimonadota bacterium]
LRDCGDWPPIRVFGTDERFGNCQECHGSQVTIGFERESGRFETRVKSLSINCESCHGPARAHVDLANSGGLGGSEELGVRPLGLLSEDESLEVCFQCHALKGVIEPGYLPGTPLQDYYSLLMPLLGDRPLLPDGRVREFAYQQNHIASDCYLNGTMNCLDCHDPHSSSYRDIYSRPLIGRFDDRQCTDCHASKAVAPQLHTKHAVDSRGSQCVTCHMPFLQHPEVGSELRFARSDHSIPIPRPAFDSGLGLMNACAECHRNISTDSLQRATDSWWGELKPHKPVVQGAFRAFNGEAAISPGELLHPDTDHVMAQMSALTSVFERYLSPNMSVQDSALVEGLKSLTFHDNVDIRSVALAALHLAFGDDPKLRRFLVERLRSLSSEDYAVRSRWVLTLGFYADTYRESGRPGDAITVYNKALELLPDHSGIFRNMGLAYHAALDFQAAVAQFRRSLEIDPSHALTWVNMGVSLDRMELEREAEVAYRRALEVNPMEPLAYFNLGNVLLRRGDVLQAVAQYEQAVLLSPSLAYGHYYMARGLIQMEEYERALDAARLAVEFDPNISGAQEMLADLERFFGG